MRTASTPSSAQSLRVLRAEHFRVTHGANLGDPVGVSDELALDDIYRLSPIAAEAVLRVQANPSGPFRVVAGTEIGVPGNDLHLDCTLTMMSEDGHICQVIVLVETGSSGHITAIYMLPLSAMRPRFDYALVGIDTDSALATFAQMTCVSFTKGTMITLATGAQCAVEDLAVGDMVLTRDDGAQAIRWIGHSTIRAIGNFAPVELKAGALNNTNDLVVSPDHRLFVYQRRDELGAGRSEILIRARHLVNGDTIRRIEGGFVEYYQMLFDRHQIIFAEGIAAESMLVDERTAAMLPSEMDLPLSELLPGHRESAHGALEVAGDFEGKRDIAAALRKSSGG